MHISSKDLNLLVVAAALFRRRNVSKAARDLGLSQSAVSHALGRLRDQFGDPMFVRTARGVSPTEFARGVEEEIQTLVSRSDLLFHRKKNSDPGRAEGRITIATTDYFEAVVLSKLQPALAKEAPGLQLSVRPTLGDLPRRDIEEGRIDLAVAGFYADVPEGFYQMKLREDSFACAVRKGHPKFRGDSLSMDDYFAADHALITLQGDFKDRVIQALGNRKAGKRLRRITYGTFSFTGMAWVLSQSDLLLTAPLSLLAEYRKRFPIRVLKCPVDFGTLELRMVWHAQTHSDPMRAWFRAKLRAACGPSPGR